MENNIIILGLKKSAVILDALAFKLEDKRAKAEALDLVDCINEAVKIMEKQNDHRKQSRAGCVL